MAENRARLLRPALTFLGVVAVAALAGPGGQKQRQQKARQAVDGEAVSARLIRSCLDPQSCYLTVLAYRRPDTLAAGRWDKLLQAPAPFINATVRRQYHLLEIPRQACNSVHEYGKRF